MLVMRGALRGLDAIKIVGGGFYTPTSPPPPPPPIKIVEGGFYTIPPEYSPTSAAQMSLAQVKDTRRALLIAISDRNKLELKAILPKLNSTCPPTSFVGTTCYNGNVTSPAELIPGTFEVLGVAFNVGEVGLTRSPRFDRTYAPNTEQRLLIQFDVAIQSADLAPGLINAAVYAQLQATNQPTFNVAGHVKQFSVNQAMGMVPGLAYKVNNFNTLPPQPTPEELTGSGGYQKWISRGGWPIYTPLITGKMPWWDKPTTFGFGSGNVIGPMPCMSIACRCGSNPLPACIKGGVPTTNDKGGSGFRVYVTIDQVAPFSFRMALVHDDPSWWDKLGYTLEGIMTKLGNVFCTGQPVLNDQMTAATAEKDVDSNGNPCTRGSAGCTHLTPSAAATGSVGMAVFLAEKWCGHWVSDHAPINPQNTIPPTPDPPMLPPSFTGPPVPLWLLGIAGIVGGALLFSRR